MVKTMAIAKRLNLTNIFIFLFLVLFPFGQITRVTLPIFEYKIPLLPIDLIAFCGGTYAVWRKFKKPEIFKYFYDFGFVAALIFFFSVAEFKLVELTYGLFYLVRLWSYIYFFVYAYNFAVKKGNKELLLNSLLSVSIVSSLFGWIQFFKFPDIKPFFVYGWDEHLFRLVGTFLDPTFLALIIVFGIVISMNRIIEKNDNKYYWFTGFLLVSLSFTYSRAGYLAFLASTAYLLYAKNKIGYILYPVLILAGLIFILPTSRNPTISFFRSFSAIARVENYKETLKVFRKSPIYGVGYNNLCAARQKFIGPESFSSHSCSGSDSSLLSILATMGLAGLFSFLSLLWGVGRYIRSNVIVVSSAIALLVHSLFSNSIFYSFVMGYLIILMSTQIRVKK